MHDNGNDLCPWNDPETFANPATRGLPCTCPQMTAEELLRTMTIQIDFEVPDGFKPINSIVYSSEVE